LGELTSVHRGSLQKKEAREKRKTLKPVGFGEKWVGKGPDVGAAGLEKRGKIWAWRGGKKRRGKKKKKMGLL